MSNVSFQGHTNLVYNPKIYNEAFQRTVRKSRDLKPFNQYCLRPNYEYTSSSVDNNMIVIVRNEKKGFLKFVPITGDNEGVIKEIADRVDNFVKLAKEGCENMTAWIIGGEPVNSKNGTSMIKTLNKIADVLCDRPNIDTSILAGGKKAQENLVIYPRSHNIELVLEKEKGTNLEDVFDIVELNNTDII